MCRFLRAEKDREPEKARDFFLLDAIIARIPCSDDSF